MQTLQIPILEAIKKRLEELSKNLHSSKDYAKIAVLQDQFTKYAIVHNCEPVQLL